MVAVPARATPFVMRDVVAKGIKTVHFFTSGFAETGTEDGRKLSAQIEQMAKDAGILVIGPNCMEVYNSENGMRFDQNQPVGTTGGLTVLGQSGAHTSSLISMSQTNGVGVNKGINFGNGINLDSSDLLEYFTDDPNTQMIAMYVEGPKDARRLLEALRTTAALKPVVLWKGGQTPAGQRMATSHTGSLAGAVEVWEAVYRQTGAIGADSLEEALDVVKALAYLKPVTGDGVGIIGGTGGQSVAMSDDFNRADLQVPTLAPHTLEALGGGSSSSSAPATSIPWTLGASTGATWRPPLIFCPWTPTSTPSPSFGRAWAGGGPRRRCWRSCSCIRRQVRKPGSLWWACFGPPLPTRMALPWKRWTRPSRAWGSPRFPAPPERPERSRRSLTTTGSGRA